MKLGPDGHLQVYQCDEKILDWNDIYNLSIPRIGNYMYPMVCGGYGIFIHNGQCSCPLEADFFRTLDEKKKDVGCSQTTSINCNSLQYHNFIELRNTT